MYINDKLDELLNAETIRRYSITYKHHVVFWVIYFAINTLRWGSVHDDFALSLKTNLIGFPIHIALAYFNIYFLMPKYVYTRKYVLYAFLMVACLFIMLLVKFNLTYYLIDTNVMPEGPGETDSITFNYAMTTMIGELYVVAFATAIKVTVDWLREHSKLHELEKRQLTTELKFLRSQVSPHFFFNTLNNVYSLTLEKSNKAPEVILKLSELMRYLLYATRKRKQDLKSEIDCIQNYIDLERIRFDDSLQIDIGISGDMENKTIAPMLLVPLIENCFKHGATKSIGEIHIAIDINVTDDYMYFNVSNTVPKKEVEGKVATRGGGIGLSNVKKRLELGYTPEDYELSIFEKDNMFHVNLKLKV
ncbi:Histidine kinase [Flagellimonas pacifica]|uniref:Histidine kinase n=2 Tax=Flagellimonas pacifica TaxID=1247520 RepID=A0A285ME78_9FLAO|nr:Histidine kinase [Allomuricauda parva]